MTLNLFSFQNSQLLDWRIYINSNIILIVRSFLKVSCIEGGSYFYMIQCTFLTFLTENSKILEMKLSFSDFH